MTTCQNPHRPSSVTKHKFRPTPTLCPQLLLPPFAINCLRALLGQTMNNVTSIVHNPHGPPSPVLSYANTSFFSFFLSFSSATCLSSFLFSTIQVHKLQRQLLCSSTISPPPLIYLLKLSGRYQRHLFTAIHFFITIHLLINVLSFSSIQRQSLSTMPPPF